MLETVANKFKTRPSRIRTHDHPVRSRAFYPTELSARPANLFTVPKKNVLRQEQIVLEISTSGSLSVAGYGYEVEL